MKHLISAALLVAILASALRHDTPRTTIMDAEARLLFVGDLMPGRYVGASMAVHGFDAPFAVAAPFLSSADLTIGNLEGPLVPTPRFTIPAPSTNQPLLTGDARAASALARSGIDILSVANNHSYDAGQAGFNATMDALSSAGIAPLGFDSYGYQQPVIRDVRGLKIAFLAYTAIPPNVAPDADAGGKHPAILQVKRETSVLDPGPLSREVEQARQVANVVVIVMHWGTEYSTLPDESQHYISQVASSAGADLVVGAHPHVAQGLSLLHGEERSTLVAYSLGNALFDQSSRAETRQGMALECTVDSRGVRQARLVPLEIQGGDSGFSVHIAGGAAGQQTLERAAQSTPLNLQWKAIWDASQPDPGIALAYSRDPDPGGRSSIEELGMGSPAKVELRSGTLSVSRQQPSGVWQRVWSTKAEWQVKWYTVGDADADGRPELVYALWKRRLVSRPVEQGGIDVDMQGGAVLPHIYVNGWREGEMRPVWHGSPRPAPVLSLAVAHAGEAGKPLLAVLESGDAQREQSPGSLRLWEWTGGFGYHVGPLVPGAYSELWSDGDVFYFR